MTILIGKCSNCIEEGILVPVYQEVVSLATLMAVHQPIEQKVHPVLDFKLLNSHVSSHTGSSVICATIPYGVGGRWERTSHCWIFVRPILTVSC